MKRGFVIVVIVTMFLLSLNICSALSNESTQALEKLETAKDCYNEMISQKVPISRANVSLQSTINSYEAQLALEEKFRKPDYSITEKSSENVCYIKKISIEARDELEIFQTTYDSTQETINLSSMDSDYQKIILSFNEERFEDTIELIDKGYSLLSEIESSQTTLKLFYSSTTISAKQFLEDNWRKLSIGLIIFIAVLIVFWKAIKKIRVYRKIKHLEIQKNTLKELVGELQKKYFKSQGISEAEYRIKLERFKEMIRDINRQIPLLKETLIKLNKKDSIEKSKSKNKK